MSKMLEGGEDKTCVSLSWSEAREYRACCVRGGDPPHVTAFLSSSMLSGACSPAKVRVDMPGQLQAQRRPAAVAGQQKVLAVPGQRPKPKKTQMGQRSQGVLEASRLLCHPGQAKEASWKGGPVSLSGSGHQASGTFGSSLLIVFKRQQR